MTGQDQSWLKRKVTARLAAMGKTQVWRISSVLTRARCTSAWASPTVSRWATVT